MATNEAQQKRSSDLNILAFWKAQQKPWRITVIRTSMERLGYKMILPYLSLFIILLGATKAQLGLITSLGLIVTAFLGPYLGQLIDRGGPKRVYIIGILILMGCYLAFYAAPVWQVAAIGMLLHQLGAGIGGASCASICGNCLASCDRAKGMLVCESLAAGLLGIVGPMLSGWILVNMMGVTGTPTDPDSIRPLFLITLVITGLSLLVVIFRLENIQWGTGSKEKRSVVKDAVAILKADKNCVKWLFCSGVSAMPMAMVIPYIQVFAAEVKHADAATLAAITTATAVTSVCLGYFLGILSDRIGRKKIVIATILLYIAGLVLLMVTKVQSLLIIVGLMAGFQELGMTLAASMQNELVPRSVIGRWQGVVRFFSSTWSAIMAAVAGFLYEATGGMGVFIIYIACELLIRIPLLLSMPETLNYKVDESKFAALMN